LFPAEALEAAGFPTFFVGERMRFKLSRRQNLRQTYSCTALGRDGQGRKHSHLNHLNHLNTSTRRCVGPSFRCRGFEPGPDSSRCKASLASPPGPPGPCARPIPPVLDTPWRRPRLRSVACGLAAWSGPKAEVRDVRNFSSVRLEPKKLVVAANHLRPHDTVYSYRYSDTWRLAAESRSLSWRRWREQRRTWPEQASPIAQKSSVGPFEARTAGAS
jgi:hypothetical protein